MSSIVQTGTPVTGATIPLLVCFLSLALFAAFAVNGRISGEIVIMIVVLVTGGFTYAETGMELRPVAQVATPIRGALTAPLPVIAMTHFKVL